MFQQASQISLLMVRIFSAEGVHASSLRCPEGSWDTPGVLMFTNCESGCREKSLWSRKKVKTILKIEFSKQGLCYKNIS